MITSPPLVSIAVCTFNGQAYLKQQLETLINQTYQQIEIIVVDDCSTDETQNICNAFKSDKLVFHRNELNLGYVKNFEKAIKLCKGNYICLCDQDDVWELNKIEVLINHIGNHILIYHNSDFIDGNGKKIGDESMGSRYNMYDGNSALPFILSNCISGHAAMFSKQLVPKLLPFDSRFFHDWWLAYVAFNIGTVKYLNQILVHYRQHETSITDNLNIKVNQPVSNIVNRIAIDIDWVKKCSEFHFNKQQKLIKNAYLLFNSIQYGRRRIDLFLFLIKYYDLIFFIISKKKKVFSKINYARKVAFSTNPPFSRKN